MTLYISSSALTGNVSFNVSNVSGTHELKITSQYGKEVTTWPLSLVETNDRYSEFTLNFTEAQRAAHSNGIYNYMLLQDDAAINTGLLKLVVENGGSYDTVEYISNNDDREATTYYRPEY